MSILKIQTDFHWTIKCHKIFFNKFKTHKLIPHYLDIELLRMKTKKVTKDTTNDNDMLRIIEIDHSHSRTYLFALNL